MMAWWLRHEPGWIVFYRPENIRKCKYGCILKEMGYCDEPDAVFPERY